MNKNLVKKSLGGALMSCALLATLCACESGAKKAEDEASRLADSLARVEDSLKQIEESRQAVEDENADSLKIVEEMVGAVENADIADKDWKKAYGASFFNNEANKAAAASATKYAVTSSGLKYVIVNKGNGQSPKPTDVVTVDYTGMLTDGTVFDSSIDRGEPTQFPLNRVIPGWTEGLQLMQPGGVAVFYIPSDLAYGPQGIPGAIPPSAPLIFWVRLLKVN